MTKGIGKVYGPAEAGRELGVSAATVKRTAAEIGVEPLLTQSGARLFTAEQVGKLRAERERRAKEVAR
ncbi:MAG: hypothetical protein HZC54_24785 [Verrucomicrobia bacterium]|nr:hypothetical protein [Verrucomicrobiota bacterium]